MNANGGHETAMKANPTIAVMVTRTRDALMMLIFSVFSGGLYCLPMGGAYKSGLGTQAKREVFSH